MDEFEKAKWSSDVCFGDIRWFQWYLMIGPNEVDIWENYRTLRNPVCEEWGNGQEWLQRSKLSNLHKFSNHQISLGPYAVEMPRN